MGRRISRAFLHEATVVIGLSCATQAQPVCVHIPAGDMKSALDEFVKQTKVQMVYRTDDVAGLQNHAVNGTMSVDTALELLLSGTDISMRRAPSGEIAVFRSNVRRNDLPPTKWPIFMADNITQETVTVTGYRESLAEALNLKQNAVGIRDSILAEDIGKYPASNIAESLMRIPGVVIARDTRTDEGKSVSVRGLDASYTIVTLNGNPVRMVTGTSVGSNNRSVDIDGLGADLFRRVDFYKTPQADLDEGGIGGVIDLRTPRPFDYDRNRAALTFGYSVNTYRNKAMPRGSVQFNATHGAFGALLAFTFSENAYQLMGSETAGWGQSRNSEGSNVIGTTFDLGPADGGYDARADIGGYTATQIEQAFIPRFISRQHLELEDRTRYSGLLSLQYRPSDRLDVGLEVLATKMIDKRSEYTLGAYFRSTSTSGAGWTACQSAAATAGSSGCSGIVPLSVTIDGNNNLYGTFANMGWVDENRWYDGDEKYVNGTLTATYRPTDRISVTAVASSADNSAFYSDNRLYFYMYDTTVVYDPAVNYKFPKVTTDTDMTDISLYANPSIDSNINREDDRVRVGKLTAAAAAATGLKALGTLDVKAGLSWVSAQKSNDIKSSATAVMDAGTSNGVSVSSMAISDYAIDHIPVSNFLAGIRHGERVMNWATVPRSFYESLHMNDILERQDSTLSGVYDVTEMVRSLFVMANTEGEVWRRRLRLNVGLRYANTRLWGYNYGTSRPDSEAVVYTRIPIHNAYGDLLPSFAAAYDLCDDLTLRLVLGKAITRASLGSIAQGTNIPSRFTPEAFSGNPKLKPLKSINIDGSLDWYFSQGAVLSAGLFYKDLKNLLSTQTETVAFKSLNLPWSSLDPGVFGSTENPDLEIRLSHPINLNPMVVKGIEAYYQQPFSFFPAPFDGAGAMLNFTYTAGAIGGQGSGFTANDGNVYRMQINGLSAYTYSAAAYYERGDYGVRVSYSWHSKATGSKNYYNTNLLLWRQARGGLDATVNYKVNDTIALRLDATNLLNADEYTFAADGTHGHCAIASGSGLSRVNYDYLHGSTFMLSVSGQI